MDHIFIFYRVVTVFFVAGKSSGRFLDNNSTLVKTAIPIRTVVGMSISALGLRRIMKGAYDRWEFTI